MGLGALIMFMLMGAMIAFVGQFDRHPLFDFKMKWWMIGSVLGAVFMLMFILLTYSEVETMMQSSLISWTGLTSPFWALIDGVIIGLIMSFAEIKIAGKGAQLPLQ
jgi:predicted membrane chloride channel (bestrophin family)